MFGDFVSNISMEYLIKQKACPLIKLNCLTFDKRIRNKPFPKRVSVCLSLKEQSLSVYFYKYRKNGIAEAVALHMLGNIETFWKL